MAKSGKAEKWAARGARLSAALRENLKKRKAQAKARAQTQSGSPDAETSAPDAALKPQPPDFRRNPGGRWAAKTSG